MAGAKTDAELERQHVHGFGGHIVLLEALRTAHVVVHGHGLGLKDDRNSIDINPGTIVLLVGKHQIEVVVDPPGHEAEEWRIRVPTNVVVRQGDADPGRASRIHDAGPASALRAAGFVLAQANTSVEGGIEQHRAVWTRVAQDARGTASVIKSISALETRVEPHPDDGFWRSMGDLSSMQALGERLTDLGTTEVTPWGLTLRAADGRELAVINAEGRGTFKVCLVLAEGFGARGARRRSESVLGWFEREVAPTWLHQGFTNARRGGVAVVEQAGEHRWAVVIDLSFTADEDVAEMLGWAREHGVLAFPQSS